MNPIFYWAWSYFFMLRLKFNHVSKRGTCDNRHFGVLNMYHTQWNVTLHRTIVFEFVHYYERIELWYLTILSKLVDANARTFKMSVNLCVLIVSTRLLRLFYKRVVRDSPNIFVLLLFWWVIFIQIIRKLWGLPNMASSALLPLLVC